MEAPKTATAQRSHVDGSQSLARAAELLSHVAHAAEEGARLARLVSLSGFNIATARRLLQALVVGGLLTFDTKSKLYKVGPAIYSYAVKGSAIFSQRELFMPALANIAQRTDDTVLFSIRSGSEAVCLIRREGAFPIRVMSLEEGSRRPLGVGSGSLAILAFLSDDERRRLLEQCAPLYPLYALSEGLVAKGVSEARRMGFSFNPGLIVDGIYGVGVPILRGTHAVASISVAAIASRMTPKRRLEVVRIIREEVAALHEYQAPGGDRVTLPGAEALRPALHPDLVDQPRSHTSQIGS